MLGPYQPGTPGIKWTEDQAMIIRSKILYLWQNWKNTVKDFDFGTNTATNTDYVYDKDKLLSTKDCGDRGKEILLSKFCISTVSETIISHVMKKKQDFKFLFI